MQILKQRINVQNKFNCLISVLVRIVILVENIPAIKGKFLICYFTLRKVGGNGKKGSESRLSLSDMGKKGKIII